MSLDKKELRKAILKEVKASFPKMKVSISAKGKDPSHYEITFVEESFADMYPLQRSQRLLNLFSEDFFEDHLQDTIWFELAPGETPDDLIPPPDEEMLDRIKLGVLETLNEHRFFHALADFLGTKPEETCQHDFDHAKRLLTNMGLSENDQYLFLHVLMQMGAVCDCEILSKALE